MKKKSKKDYTKQVIVGSFDEIIAASVSNIPPANQKAKKKKGKKK